MNKSFLLAVGLLLGLAACTAETSDPTDTRETDSEKTETTEQPLSSSKPPPATTEPLCWVNGQICHCPADKPPSCPNSGDY